MPPRIMELQKYLRAMFLLDQQGAREKGAMPLSFYLETIAAHPCYFNYMVYCDVPPDVCSQIDCKAKIEKVEPLQDDDA